MIIIQEIIEIKIIITLIPHMRKNEIIWQCYNNTKSNTKMIIIAPGICNLIFDGVISSLSGEKIKLLRSAIPVVENKLRNFLQNFQVIYEYI